MNNRLKILAYVLLTWILFFFLSFFTWNYVRKTIHTYSLVDAQSTIVAWASLFLGLILAARRKKWAEILLGMVLFVVCLFPIIGLIAGMFYFIRSYAIVFNLNNQRKEASGCAKV